MRKSYLYHILIVLYLNSYDVRSAFRPKTFEEERA